MNKELTPILMGPYDAGRLMSPKEYDSTEFEEGWRYELIEGVLVVRPIAKRSSRGMAGRLIHWLEAYCERRRKGIEFLTVLFEESIRIPNGNRRRSDVAIWVGLGRNPRDTDVPTISVEFVSGRGRDIKRDYIDKRADYLAAGVREYWVIDRFRRTLTALRRRGRGWEERVAEEGEVYTTPLLPDFKLDMAALLARADALPEED